MKLDFMSFGGGGGGHGSHRFDMFAPARSKEPPPLDDARHIIRAGLLVAGLFFGLFLLVSVAAPISGATTSAGTVTSDGATMLVQPVNGGVVTDLLVREGQHVRAGQPLVRLNGVRSAAAAEQAQARRDGLRALQARLIAERDGQAAILVPPDLTARSGDRVVSAAIASQALIFQHHRAILAAERRIADTETRSASAQQVGAERQLHLLNQELAAYRGLLAKGFAPLTTVRSLERNAAGLQAQSVTAANSVARAGLQGHRIADQQVMDAAGQLVQVEEQLAQADPALRVVRADADHDVLRAQVPGRVAGVAAVGPGTVLGPGRTVMRIVPDARALIVEALVKPSDVAEVHVGSSATLRFTSVHPHGTSAFQGRVFAMSPGPVDDGGTAPGFRVQIAVTDPAKLRAEGLRLQPGMPVTVQVRTRARTMFNYLMTPLEEATSRAFREK